MTEPYGYDDQNDDSDNDDRQVTLSRSAIRKMEQDAKQARKAQQEAESLRRELAFARAGIGDLTERQQKALFATLDGELSADTVRTAAEELGFVKPAAPATPDPERAALEQMSQSSAGAADPGDEDPVARLYRLEREGGHEAVVAQLRADGSLAG